MISERLLEDMKSAMRAGDKDRLRAIRSLRADLQEKAIQSQRGDDGLTEDEELNVVQKAAKQRKDAIEQYEAAGREDLAEKEREELAVIEEYLPEQLSDDELTQEVRQIIEETGASSMQDMGRVMGKAMQKLKGKADGSRISSVAKDLLQ